MLCGHCRACYGSYPASYLIIYCHILSPCYKGGTFHGVSSLVTTLATQVVQILV